MDSWGFEIIVGDVKLRAGGAHDAHFSAAGDCAFVECARRCRITRAALDVSDFADAARGDRRDDDCARAEQLGHTTFTRTLRRAEDSVKNHDNDRRDDEPTERCEWSAQPRATRQADLRENEPKATERCDKRGDTGRA